MIGGGIYKKEKRIYSNVGYANTGKIHKILIFTIVCKLTRFKI